MTRSLIRKLAALGVAAGLTVGSGASFAAAAALLVAVALAASYLPVRRVLRTDPANILRE